jgi:hypothetical protein
MDMAFFLQLFEIISRDLVAGNRNMVRPVAVRTVASS